MAVVRPIAAVFLPWWGPAPSWYAQFLARAAQVQALMPVLVGDAAAWDAPGRVERAPCTMDEFEQRASETAGVPVRKCDARYPRGQALCELRPLLGEMYDEGIAEYPWWGYGDWDVVWGDWDAFLTGAVVTHFDIISTNAHRINGPFVLFRNTEVTRTLYRDRLDAVQSPQADAFLDEQGMSEIVAARTGSSLRVLYAGGLNGHDRNGDNLLWCVVVDGKVYRANVHGQPVGHEVLKFHFPGRKEWPVIPAAEMPHVR